MGEVAKKINNNFWQEWFENSCKVEEEYLDYGFGIIDHGELTIDHHNYIWEIVNIIIEDYSIPIPDGYYDFTVIHRNPDDGKHKIRMGFSVRNNKINPYSWWWEEIL